MALDVFFGAFVKWNANILVWGFHLLFSQAQVLPRKAGELLEQMGEIIKESKKMFWSARRTL